MNVRLLLCLSPLAFAPDALAQAGGAPLSDLFACREIADDSARLACLDAAVADLHRDTEAGEVMTVEREDLEAAEEATFGLSIPNFSLPRLAGFGRRDSEDAPSDLAEAETAAEAPDRVVTRNDEGVIERIEGLPVTALEVDPYGKALVTLANGQRWRQTDSTDIFRLERGVQPGMTANIRTGAMTSYFVQLSTSSRWFRAERVE